MKALKRSRNITVKMPVEMVMLLDNVARSYGVSRGELIRSIIIDWVASGKAKTLLHEGRALKASILREEVSLHG